jgi:hypothetical protein
MAEQVQEAAITWHGTVKSAGASLASASSALSTIYGALPTGAKHANITVVTGPIYYENDGTAADADTNPLSTGDVLRIRNNATVLGNLRIYAAGAYDIRITVGS